MYGVRLSLFKLCTLTKQSRAKDYLLTFAAGSKLFKLQNRSDTSKKVIAQGRSSDIKNIAYFCHDVVEIIKSDEDTVGSGKHIIVTSVTIYLKMVRKNKGVSVTSVEEDRGIRPLHNSDKRIRG